MNDALAKLVRDGVVEPQQAYDKAVDKDEFNETLKKTGHAVVRLAGVSETTLKPIASGPALAVAGRPAKTAGPAAPVPSVEQLKISNWLMICKEQFQCCPLKEVVLPEEPSVYVVLGVDQWGSWTVLDVGQTDKAGDAIQAAERHASWMANCPTQNLWFGLHAVKGSLVGHRKALEGQICAEHKPPCVLKRKVEQ
jgi:hypothetical protein